MFQRERFQFLSLTVSLTCVGCASVDPRPDFDEARSMIRATTGVDSIFDPAVPVLSAPEIDAVFAGGLTLDEASQLALLNNRRLQAGFMELGVGRADFVQASLLSNPTLSLAFLFPSGGGRPQIGGDLLASVADVWQLPRRKEFARLNQEQRLLELSRFAGELVADTRSAYFDIVAAREARTIAAENVKLQANALALVSRRFEGGVGTKTDEHLARNLVLEAELDSSRLELETSFAEQRLGQLLSLTTDCSRCELTDALPTSGAITVDSDTLVARALESRLDVRALGLAVVAAEAAVRVEQGRGFPESKVGLAAERPEAGSSTRFLGGVAGSIELPMFDQNRAQIARAEFERDALAKELEGLSADVAQQVRGSLQRFASAQQMTAFVQDVLLPQAERTAALAARAYELGDTTILTSLESQRFVLEARRSLVEAQTAAVRQRIELERRMGGPLHLPPN